MTDLYTYFLPLDPFTKVLRNTLVRKASISLKSLLMAVFSRPGMISRNVANKVGPLILTGLIWEFQTSRGQEKALNSQRQEECIYHNGYQG